MHKTGQLKICAEGPNEGISHLSKSSRNQNSGIQFRGQSTEEWKRKASSSMWSEFPASVLLTDTLNVLQNLFLSQAVYPFSSQYLALCCVGLVEIGFVSLLITSFQVILGRFDPSAFHPCAIISKESTSAASYIPTFVFADRFLSFSCSISATILNKFEKYFY